MFDPINFELWSLQVKEIKRMQQNWMKQRSHAKETEDRADSAGNFFSSFHTGQEKTLFLKISDSIFFIIITNVQSVVLGGGG
jgi:hypothetical protein